MAKAAMIAPMLKLASAASAATGIGGLVPTLMGAMGGGAKSLSPLSMLLSGGKGAAAAGTTAATAGSSAASALTPKYIPPPMPRPKPADGFLPAPPMPRPKPAEMQGVMQKQVPASSWIDRLTAGMDKNKMRELGLGMMSQAQEQQAPASMLQLAPFQPGGGGGGGAMQEPQLMALLQQLGLNKVQ